MGEVIPMEAREEKGTRIYVAPIGSVESALDQSLPDLLSTPLLFNGDYYEPPVSPEALTQIMRVNAHHESAIFCKVATIVQGYQPGAVQVISRRGIRAITTDYIYLGNFYLQIVRNRVGRVVELRHLHARTMRRKKNPGEYVQINGIERADFELGEIIHVAQYAPESNVYGLPEYLGAVNSLLLNEDATLFRRRYYRNGAHAGFIFYTTGEEVDEDDLKVVAKKIGETKGVGNFQSIHVHLPNAQSKAEVLHVGDFAKDEWDKIKTISRDDVISAHRVPPAILAVLTDNKQPNTGDLDKHVKLYNKNVVQPIQLDIAEGINEHLAEDQQISFDPYVLSDDEGEEGDPE